MHFTDFYFAGGRREIHYVTIVLARAGPQIDQVYQAIFLQLERRNNFL